MLILIHPPFNKVSGKFLPYSSPQSQTEGWGKEQCLLGKPGGNGILSPWKLPELLEEGKKISLRNTETC